MPVHLLQCSGRGARKKEDRCYASKRLRKRLELYTPPWQEKHGKCDACGRPMSQRRYGPKTLKARKPCTCDNYSFPHYRGTGACKYNPNRTEEELAEASHAAALAYMEKLRNR